MSHSLLQRAVVVAAVAGLLSGCSSDDESADIDAQPDADAGDVAPDTAADVVPDTAADAAPDAAVDVAPDTTGDAGGDTTGDTAGDAAGPAPTFTEVREQVIAPSCSFSVCHGGRSGAGGLALGRDPFAALVGVASTAVPDRILVVAGDVDASYLWEKLTQDPPAAGEIMPPGSPLDADRLELVRRWIEAGAPNN